MMDEHDLVIPEKANAPFKFPVTMIGESLVRGTLNADDIYEGIKDYLPREIQLNWAFYQLYGNKEQREQFLYEVIYGWMNNHAPQGTYFGSHPGNSSDMGFWVEEMLDHDLMNSEWMDNIVTQGW